MQEGQPLQDLPEPTLDDLPPEDGDGLDKGVERAVVVIVHELGDEDDLLGVPVIPGGVEGDDVVVVDFFQDADLVQNPVTSRGWERAGHARG
jgi:hypothetical protein